MGRERMVPGDFGSISTKQVAPDKFEATCWYREESGKRRQKYATATTKAKAIAALKRRLAAQSPSTGTQLHRDSTINELADAWWRRTTLENTRQASTLRQYKHALDTIVRRELGTLRISEATTQRLDAKVQEWIESGKLSRARIGRLTLSALFGHAIKVGVISVDPVRGTTSVPKTDNEIRSLSTADIPVLVNAARKWDSKVKPGPKSLNPLADIVILMLGTGCRTGEALAVRWGDINFNASTVVIRGTIVEVKGQTPIRKDTTKSKAGMRTLAVDPFVMRMLEIRHTQRPVASQNPNDAVYVTSNGTWLSPSNVRRQWRTVREAAGYDWVIPTTFRKTVATQVARTNGAASVASQLGHASEQVARLHYISKAPLAPDNSAVTEKFWEGIDDIS